MHIGDVSWAVLPPGALLGRQGNALAWARARGWRNARALELCFQEVRILGNLHMPFTNMNGPPSFFWKGLQRA